MSTSVYNSFQHLKINTINILTGDIFFDKMNANVGLYSSGDKVMQILDGTHIWEILLIDNELTLTAQPYETAEDGNINTIGGKEDALLQKDAFEQLETCLHVLALFT